MTQEFFGIRIGPKRCLGVDIGTSAIKIVELSQQGNRKKLENYGEMEATSLYEQPFRTFEKSTLNLSGGEVVKAITAIFGEAKMKTNDAYFSIPDFSTFFTTFHLPSMSKEELPQAVQYEARQHIPLPLSEVVLDWQVIGEKSINKKLSDFSILLVAVPNEVIHQYQEIAKFAKLNIVALEAEVFGLARALVKEEEKGAVVLVDLGARSTTINIIDSGIIKISHSFDTSGNDFTNLISRGLNLEMREAERVKKEQGILPASPKPDSVGGPSETAQTREAILPMVDLILSEMKKISQNFYSQESKTPKKIIIAGGSALLPGLADYFSKVMGIEVEIANPFIDLFCPPILNDILKEMGPRYAVAVGTAIRGVE